MGTNSFSSKTAGVSEIIATDINQFVNALTGAAQYPFAVFVNDSVDASVKLSEAAGARKFKVLDSAATEVWATDSDGEVYYRGTKITTNGILKHEFGGLEFNASAITTGGLIKGDSAGVMEILAKGAANTVLKMAADASDFAWAAASGATLVGKTSAETVNNSTTLQDDDTLKFTGAADTNYSVMGCFRFQSIEAADFKWAMTAAGSSTIDLGVVYYNVAGSTSTTNAAWTFLAEDASVSTVGFGATAPYVASFFMGTVLMDGSGGEVAVQWAQHSAVASNTQMLPGAWIRYEAI